jgi:hypothetical protein
MGAASGTATQGAGMPHFQCVCVCVIPLSLPSLEAGHLSAPGPGEWYCFCPGPISLHS